jgi:hypothetical protein
MRRIARAAVLTPGVATVAVAFGGTYAYVRRGGASELPGFFIWSLPLSLVCS